MLRFACCPLRNCNAPLCLPPLRNCNAPLCLLPLRNCNAPLCLPPQVHADLLGPPCPPPPGPLPTALAAPLCLLPPQVQGDLRAEAVAEARQEIAILRACRDVNIVQFQVCVCECMCVGGAGRQAAASGSAGRQRSPPFGRRLCGRAQTASISAAAPAPAAHKHAADTCASPTCRRRRPRPVQGAYLGPDQTMLVTEYMEGGDLLHNIAAKRVSWYRRGKKVGGQGRVPGVAWLSLSGGAAQPGGRVLSLAGWQAQGPAFAAQTPCLQIALDVARGLVFLHSKRVAHFDLKSPNILLARQVGPVWEGVPAAVVCVFRHANCCLGPCGSALHQAAELAAPHWTN